MIYYTVTLYVILPYLFLYSKGWGGAPLWTTHVCCTVLDAACWLHTMKSDQHREEESGMGDLFTATVTRKMNRTVMNREWAEGGGGDERWCACMCAVCGMRKTHATYWRTLLHNASCKANKWDPKYSIGVCFQALNCDDQILPQEITEM
jgi:hypothetical protein